MSGLPTLGWAVLEFLCELPSPSDPSEPLVLTEPQAAFLLDWYTFDPRTLRFVYRRGALMWPKGRGKSPLAAAIAIAELAGPVLPDGIDARGRPVGRPWGTGGSPPPLVQIAATAEEQADANVFSLAVEMLTVNEERAAKALGVDPGLTRVHLRGRPGRMVPVTASGGAREGQRLTHGAMDETHLWLPDNGGTRLARVLRRNAGKTGGRTIEYANAPTLGALSVAEDTMHAVDAGEEGILRHTVSPSVDPEEDMSDPQLSKLLGQVYADTPWIDTRRILSEVRDRATGWEESRRYYFNVPGSGVNAFVDPTTWAALDEGREIERDAPVWVAFVASSGGASLIGCTEDAHLFVELLIEREESDGPDWRVPRAEVHEAVAATFAKYEVVRMHVDPFGWRDEAAEWSATYGEQVVLEFPTNSVRRFGPAVDRFRAAVTEGRIRHEGDDDLTAHVVAARLHRSRTRVEDHELCTLQKPAPGRLIDGAVAAVLAYEARAQAPPPEQREPMMAWV